MPFCYVRYATRSVGLFFRLGCLKVGRYVVTLLCITNHSQGTVLYIYI